MSDRITKELIEMSRRIARNDKYWCPKRYEQKLKNHEVIV